MADFAWLLEDGSGKWLLEDGSGVFLLEEQTEHGLEIEATHATQVLAKPRKPKLIATELTIKLMSDLITSITVNIPSIKLLPMGIFTEKLRRAFIIPTGHLKEKINKYLKEEIKIMKYESFLDKYGELGILALIKRLIHGRTD